MKILRRITNALARSDGQAKARIEIQSVLNEARALIYAEEYQRAREILLRAVKFRERLQDAKTIDWILRSLACTWIFQDRFEEQVAFFSDYVQRYPNDCAAYENRAAALWYSGRLREALEDYSRAIELKPTDLQSRSGRGQVFAELGESDKAIEDLDIALRVVEAAPEPDDSWREWHRHTEAFVRNGRAVALAGLAKIQEAMAEFEISISLSPDNAWVYYNRAKVRDRLGERDEALADYRTALAKKEPPLAPRQREVARALVGV